MPDAPGLELIRGAIEQDHPGAVLDASFEHGRAVLIADPAQVLAVLAWLRDASGHEYSFLSSLHAADYLPAEPCFGIHYELLNRNRVERIRVKAMLSDPSVGREDVEGVEDGVDPPAGPPCPTTGPAAGSARSALTRNRSTRSRFSNS